MEFSEPGIFNYSTLLLSEQSDALYVGAREAIFQLSKNNVTIRTNKVTQREKTQKYNTLFHILLFFSFLITLLSGSVVSYQAICGKMHAKRENQRGKGRFSLDVLPHSLFEV